MKFQVAIMLCDLVQSVFVLRKWLALCSYWILLSALAAKHMQVCALCVGIVTDSKHYFKQIHTRLRNIYIFLYIYI